MTHSLTDHEHSDPVHEASGNASGNASGGGRLLVLALALAQLMLVLDITVANVALPRIARSLDLGVGATPWVITVYILMLGGLMLVGGRSADVFGPRRVVVAGLVTFTTASLVAAVAWDAPSMLAARGLQGLGAAFLSPAALAMLTSTFTGAERRKALGIWAAVGGAGASVGVLVGGLLTSGPGWRWIFLINVPVGLVVLIAILSLAPRTPVAATRRSLDLTGGLAVTAATAALILALTRIGQTGDVTGWYAALLGLAVVLYALFASHELRTDEPLLDLRVLAMPRVTVGALVMLASSSLLIGLFFLLSFHFQAELGWSAMRTGLAFLPLAVGTVAGAHTAGHLVSERGPRVAGTFAFLVSASGLGLAGWMFDSAAITIAAAGLTAVGLGAGFVTATTTALGEAEHAQVGVISGVVNTCHELGAALGVAALAGFVVPAGGAAQPLADMDVALFGGAGLALGLAVLAATLIPRGKPAADAPRFMH